MSLTIIKQANGVYRWYGYPTNNAKDRDREILSGAALERTVKQIKATGKYPPLYFHHIEYPVGISDYVNFCAGIVYATGEFNSDPVSQKAAQYAIEHPESLDGSGWAMSHQFTGIPDRNGVFHQIGEIKEFTFLPLSIAANPYTEFTVGVKSMNDQQRKALDVVLGDPALVAVVEQHLTAQNKSKALDEVGTVRKAAQNAVGAGAEPVVKSPGSVLGAFLQMGGVNAKAEGDPTTEEEKPVDGEPPKPEEEKQDMPAEDMPMMEEAQETEAAAPIPEAAPAGGDTAQAIAAQIAEPVAAAVTAGVEAVQAAGSTFTPEQSQQIVDLVNTAVAPIQQAMQEMAQVMAGMTAASAETQKQLKELNVVKARNETPKRNTLVDIWKQRASQSDATKVKETDKLIGLALPEVPEQKNVWAALGFDGKDA